MMDEAKNAEEVLESLANKLKNKSQGTKAPSIQDNRERSPAKNGFYLWILGGSALVIGLLGLGGSFLWKNISEPVPETSKVAVPLVPLFGFWQKGSNPDWWLARIVKVNGRTFYLRWQGSPQRDGRGTGIGEGKGVVGADNTVTIDIAEQLRNEAQSTANGGLINPFSALTDMFGGQQEPTQILHLEGVLVPQGNGRSYFKGTYMERGGKFYPFSSWVLSPSLPKGWQTPNS